MRIRLSKCDCDFEIGRWVIQNYQKLEIRPKDLENMMKYLKKLIRHKKMQKIEEYWRKVDYVIWKVKVRKPFILWDK